MAIARSELGNFARLVWIPADIQVRDARQQKVLDSLRFDNRLQQTTDLLETSLEDLRTVYHDRLKRQAPSEVVDESLTVQGETRRQIYVIYDQRDAEITSVWTDFLFKQGFELLRPIFEGDEAEIREYHQENLSTCDGILIIYGKAGELWLRRKLREVQKSAGYGRTKPMPIVGIWLVPPRTPTKKHFAPTKQSLSSRWIRSHRNLWSPFISRLKPS